MPLRTEVALAIIRSIIAADWKFDTSQKDWDTLAVERAFKLADLFVKENEITTL